MSTLPPDKDWIDLVDVLSKWLIPVVVAAVTWLYTNGQKEREQTQRDFETAIAILRAPPTADAKALRNWAVDIFVEKTNANEDVERELKAGVRIPAIQGLQMPASGSLRVSIVRPVGASEETSRKIAGALVASANYSTVNFLERPSSNFPDISEVRYYYSADEQNAKSLVTHLQMELNSPVRLNERISERDEQRHRPGDLHIYIK